MALVTPAPWNARAVFDNDWLTNICVHPLPVPARRIKLPKRKRNLLLRIRRIPKSSHPKWIYRPSCNVRFARTYYKMPWWPPVVETAFVMNVCITNWVACFCYHFWQMLSLLWSHLFVFQIWRPYLVGSCEWNNIFISRLLYEVHDGFSEESRSNFIDQRLLQFFLFINICGWLLWYKTWILKVKTKWKIIQSWSLDNHTLFPLQFFARHFES